MNFGFVLYPGVEELDFQGPWDSVEVQKRPTLIAARLAYLPAPC